MSRHYLVCPNDSCPRLNRTKNRFRSDAADATVCPVCSTALVDASTIHVPKPTTTKSVEGGIFMKNAKVLYGIIVALLIALAVLITYLVMDNNNNNQNSYRAAESSTSTDTTIDVTRGDEHLSVYRGDTAAATIAFNDSWSGVSPDDDIDWTNNSLHLLGGTYTVQADGVISGDVKVNGKPIYDNDSQTYLVIEVKKGDKVYVNPEWMAWYTNRYSTYLIAQAVQEQFPDWSRQDSKLN